MATTDPRTGRAARPGDADATLRRLTAMLTIRRFEERLVRLHEADAFVGHYHVSIGQEAGARGERRWKKKKTWR